MADVSNMSPADAFSMLKRIMVREFDIAESEIQPSSGFEDLDMDSIDAVDLAVSVEEEIGFQFQTEDLAGIRTIQDVVDLICGNAPHPSG